MRRFIILAVVVLLVISLAGIAGGVAIAKAGPFLPGSPFFPMQNFAEQTQVWFQSPAERQTEAYFRLVERRLVNQDLRTGTMHEAEALLYLDRAIDQAVHSWSQLSLVSADQFREQLLFLLKASEIATNRLELASTQNPGLVASLTAKLTTLQNLVADPLVNLATLADVVADVPQDRTEFSAGDVNGSSTAIDPLAVPFPPGSLASQHAFYPLVGAHAEIECTDCHTDGVYDGTLNYCEACHAGTQPENHFNGDCAACHSAYAWDDVTFDHTVVNTTECASCHRMDQPANHFGNQCSACHNTSTWQDASFNHRAAGATDCKSCHSDDKPANHFSGQCSACHSTNSWQGASFNHQAAGATDCKSCHSDDKPANHFSGQCSACHSTNTWQGASFNHTGQTDCKSCHSDDRPSNHFSGQCSACHSTNTWQGASFSHTGQTDCKSCHSDDRPSNHFSGQCSQCHNTSNWDAEFTHNGQTDCVACHAGDRPNDHSGGQCSQCHNTEDWDDADDDDGGGGGGGEDDDEQGNFWQPVARISANEKLLLNCAACHTRGQFSHTAFQDDTGSAWWFEIWMKLQKLIAIQVS